MPNISVILAAAGSSSRFRHPTEKKPFIKLGQKAVWLHSAEVLLKRGDVKQLIIVVSAEDKEEFMARFGPNVVVLDLDVVTGGKERSDSIANALDAVDSKSDWILIHDAARPCIDDRLIDRVVVAAEKSGAAIPAIPVSSTLKRSADGVNIESTVDRTNLYQAQTPQVFRRSLLVDAFTNRDPEAAPTDEAQLLEQQGIPVTMVEGSPLNLKITHQADLSFARACLNALPKPKPGFF
ncbi:MAG: 2-C-methyl-D-erythritol 4-phosphate cytidylyltransferase [Planctomycetota bacterium]